MRDEKEYMRERIMEYTKKSKDSEKRVLDFLQVNCLSDLKECESLKTLELLFRIETFMAVEQENKNEKT